MLQVIKRSGKTESYAPMKIRDSLAAASDEIGQPLNEGDLNTLMRELELLLRDRGTVSSRELYILVVGILYTNGFAKMVEAYIANERNAWRIA